MPRSWLARHAAFGSLATAACCASGDAARSAACWVPPPLGHCSLFLQPGEGVLAAGDASRSIHARETPCTMSVPNMLVTLCKA